ncbi:MAG: hypothetical protein NTW97_06535 [Candidatus Krumholzibacteria bacterium]|nr:hypothetical protein [Candidatus Krumholzibacteria bacterium]
MQDDKDTGAEASRQGLRWYEKLLLVLLFGAVFGMLELFGRDALRAAGVEHKSALLYGIGIIILYASKRVAHFPGSVAVMALIAGVIKTASSHFYPCQVAAVMINGVVFDIFYSTFKGRLDSSLLYRTIAAPVIVYVSYAAFAILAAFVLREGSWGTDGWAGVRSYLFTSAISASLYSIVTIHIGYYLGNALRLLVPVRRLA